jgi:arsenite oxidase small subunit
MSEKKERDTRQEESISRRKLLKTAGGLGAAVLAVGGLAGNADAANGIYPRVKVANVKDLQPGRTRVFDYPLEGRKSILINLGCTVNGGAGHNRNLVAYSMFCTHLGCSVDLDSRTGMLRCECHQTIYDPKNSGRVIEGPAPNNLPMIALEIDDSGDIHAVGVAGLIYGLRNNLLDGKILKD